MALVKCQQCGHQRPVAWTWWPFCSRKCHEKGAK